MRKQRKPENWIEFSIEIDGRKIPGDYEVSGGVVTVRRHAGEGSYQRKSTHISGGIGADEARMLLREMATENT